MGENERQRSKSPSRLSRRSALMEGSVRRRSRRRPLFASLLVALSLLSAPSVTRATSLKLDPIALSFTSPQRGFVLSLYDCAGNTCADLRGTNDAGSSWTVVPLPRQLVQSLRLASWGTYANAYATLNVHFADAKNGWIYGTLPGPVTPATPSTNWQSRLWSTHDAGNPWRKISRGPLARAGGGVQMATHEGRTYLFASSDQSGRARLLATRSGEDHWLSASGATMWTPAGGSPLEAAFTFAGTNGWFVAGNDRGFTTSARLMGDGSWVSWKGPSIERLGASFTPINAVTKRVLLVAAQSAGFVYPPASTVPRGWNQGSSWLFISYDAGATFKPLRELSSSYRGSYATVPGSPAVPVPGTILLERAISSGYELVRSANWGRTWSVARHGALAQIIFTGRVTGFAVTQFSTSAAGSALLRTDDAGIHWSHVNL